MVKAWMIVVLCVAMNVACDQATKRVAKVNLEGRGAVSLLNNTVVLLYVENEGAFLGMFSKLPQPYRSIVLIHLPVAALVASLAYVLAARRMSLAEKLIVATIIGGGIGNLYDRIVFGSVIDFMNFGIGNLRTGILNFADISVFFGAVILIILMIRKERTRRQP